MGDRDGDRAGARAQVEDFRGGFPHQVQDALD